MSSFKANPVFSILMFLGLVSAFLLPSNFTESLAPQLQYLFAPVARPVRAIAGSFHERMSGPPPRDPRAPVQIAQQNRELIELNLQLMHEVEDLRRLNADRARLGALRPLCTPVPVIGPGLDGREALQLQASKASGLREGMCVIYSGDMVGTLKQVGVAGGQVQLVTDPGYRVFGYFRTYRAPVKAAARGNEPSKGEKGEAGYLRLGETVMVEGTGQGTMKCPLVTWKQVQEWGLAVGDFVMLEDDRFPRVAQGLRIGKVVSIAPRKGTLHADLRIKPDNDFKRMSEVMVLTKSR
jgi:cell shape-determining protein MreC